ncbi:response regulator [Gorillibacterium sp. sgz500922]|uniref:response regulator n=1 Tax=Gorillibacterium sp. sgz500922 TaxID=3446694 RepID=UPI003F67BC25
MWKVLLVEDEPFVRRKLRKLIAWEELGFSVAGEAANGEEALAEMRRELPDLVITDILMPVMDGLELLKAARAEGMSSRFVMLTCMNEFEYARRALELGASGYLLKLSMSVAALQDTLTKAGAELAEKHERNDLLMSRLYDDYYRQVWTAVCESGTGATGRQGAQDAECPPVLPVPPVSPALPRFGRVILLTQLDGPDALSPADVLERGALSREPGIWTGAFAADGLRTLFFWYRDAPVAAAPASFAALPGRGVYSHPVPPEQLAARWRGHLAEMRRLWYDGAAGWRPERSSASFASPNSPASPSPASPAGEALSWAAEKEAIQAFERERRDGLADALASYWRRLEDNRTDFRLVREAAARLDRIFASIAEGTSAADPPLADDAADSHTALLRLLLGRAEARLSATAKARESRTDHAEINRILDYLRQHYEENLSLRGMARMVAMEEHYLSRLFKQKTGDTLINHIQRLRVDKARLLLMETDLAASEIGRIVGFPNDNYFVKTFKKWTGQTPGRYRKDNGDAPSSRE